MYRVYLHVRTHRNCGLSLDLSGLSVCKISSVVNVQVPFFKVLNRTIAKQRASLVFFYFHFHMKTKPDY